MITINLLPVTTLKQKLRGQVVLGGYGFLMFVVLLTMFAVKTNVFDLTIEKLGAEKQQVEATLADARKKVQTATNVTNATVQRWKQLAAVVELEERRRDQTRILVEVESLLPKTNAWLMSLSHTGGALSIEGISTDKETVSQFLTKLESATYIVHDSVTLVQISQDLVINGIKLTKFSIRARTSFPQPDVLNKGLPEFGLPTRDDFAKAVKAVDEKLAADLVVGAVAAKKGI